MNIALAQYVYMAALRDKFILTLVGVFILSAVISWFFGSVVVVDKSRFALVFMGASLRLIGVIGIVLFVTAFVRRSFESFDVEYLLTRPISRTGLVMSYAAGIIGVIITLWCAQVFVLGVVLSFTFSSGVILWLFGLLAENIIIGITALFFSMVVGSTALASIVCFGFYVLARMLGQILSIMAHGHNGVVSEGVEFFMTAIALCLPRLDLLSQSSWLIYGVDDVAGAFTFPLMQLCVYVVVLIGATILDLRRREF